MAYSVTRSNHTQASHFRAALDGAPVAPGAKPRPRLGAALAALDVPALALSDDADAHRRLYELAVRVQRPQAFSRRWERVDNAGRHGRPGVPRARARREGERPPRPPGGVVRRRRELSGRAAPGAAHDAAAAARAARGRRRRRGRARRQALAAALRAWWSVSRKTARKAATSHDDAVALRSNPPPPPPRALVSAAVDAFT